MPRLRSSEGCATMPSELLSHLIYASAYLVTLMTGLVALGFVRLVFTAGGVVRYLSIGFLLMFAAVCARSLYWDILKHAEWIAADGLNANRPINLVLNLVVILASYYSLKAIHATIPPETRARYSLLTCVFYPPWQVRSALPSVFRPRHKK